MFVCGGQLPVTVRMGVGGGNLPLTVRMGVGELWVTIVGCIVSRGSVDVVVVGRTRKTSWPVCWPSWNFVFDALYTPTGRLFYSTGHSSESQSLAQPVHVHQTLSLSVNGYACGSVFRMLHASRTRCQLPWDGDQPTRALNLTLRAGAGTAEYHLALPLEPFHPRQRTAMQCTPTPLFGPASEHAQRFREVRVAWDALGFGVSVVFARTAAACAQLASLPGVVCQVRAFLTGRGMLSIAEGATSGPQKRQRLSNWSDQGIYSQLCLVYATAWDAELLAMTDMDEHPMRSLGPAFEALRTSTGHTYAGLRLFFDADKVCPTESGPGDDLAADGVAVGRALAAAPPASAQGTAVAPRAGAGEAGFCPRSTDDWLKRCVNRGLQYRGVEAIVPSSGCFNREKNATAAACVPRSAVAWGSMRTHFKAVVIPSRTWDVSVHHFWPRTTLGFREAPAIYSPCLQHIRHEVATADPRLTNRSVARPIIPGEEAGRPMPCLRDCRGYKTLWSQKCLWHSICAGCRQCQRAQHAAKKAYTRMAHTRLAELRQ